MVQEEEQEMRWRRRKRKKEKGRRREEEEERKEDKKQEEEAENLKSALGAPPTMPSSTAQGHKETRHSWGAELPVWGAQNSRRPRCTHPDARLLGGPGRRPIAGLTRLPCWPWAHPGVPPPACGKSGLQGGHIGQEGPRRGPYRGSQQHHLGITQWHCPAGPLDAQLRQPVEEEEEEATAADGAQRDQRQFPAAGTVAPDFLGR